jgi:diguanylate cyclase (GGDEF)-like protein
MSRTQEPIVAPSLVIGARCRQRATATVLLVATLMAVATIGVVQLLQADADRARDSQVTLAHLDTTFTVLQGVPFSADPAQHGSPTAVQEAIKATEGGLQRSLRTLLRDSAPGQLRAVEGPLAANFVLLERIREIAARSQPPPGPMSASVDRTITGVRRALALAGTEYGARASRATTQAVLGSTVLIIGLLAAFAIFYVRSRRLETANALLLEASRDEALGDALTGLGNRRALMADLQSELAGERLRSGGRTVLALFDLDGFKEYNDSFGHPAGDDLLARLGDRVRLTLQGLGTAYRMGGDEFCVLAKLDEGHDGEMISGLAAAALSDDGQGFRIGCSYGNAILPSEASTPEEALNVADQRMYARKSSGRKSAGRQSTDVLMRVLGERSSDLVEHISDVARLAHQTAQRLGLSVEDVRRVTLAAELHDVGKTAIPDAILNKPGPLDDDEWAFMRRHTLIGERIIRAAPSLATAAPLVRSTHERYDGTGYPDALIGDDIPLGSRIIAVCDAFSAMVSDRAYRPRLPVSEALAELRRCSGTQFQTEIVDAVCAMLESRDYANNAHALPLDDGTLR